MWHERLRKMSWQSIQWVSRYFNPNESGEPTETLVWIKTSPVPPALLPSSRSSSYSSSACPARHRDAHKCDRVTCPQMSAWLRKSEREWRWCRVVPELSWVTLYIGPCPIHTSLGSCDHEYSRQKCHEQWNVPRYLLVDDAEGSNF